MITKSVFEMIKCKHGRYASWAVWGPQGATPKSGMADMTVFETDAVLSVLKPNVVMLGLNLSKSIRLLPFGNFHAAESAQDYKIRYAFKDSEYYGAYMTDIIKVLEEIDSRKVMNHLDAYPELLADSLGIFREEMRDLGNSRPLILAFGESAYRLAYKYLEPEGYSGLVRLPHYSRRISQEGYKKLVFKQIAAHNDKQQYRAKESVK